MDVVPETETNRVENLVSALMCVVNIFGCSRNSADFARFNVAHAIGSTPRMI